MNSIQWKMEITTVRNILLRTLCDVSYNHLIIVISNFSANYEQKKG